MNARMNVCRRPTGPAVAVAVAFTATAWLAGAPASAQSTGPRGPAADAPPPPSIIDAPAGATERRVLTPPTPAATSSPGSPGAAQGVVPQPPVPEPSRFEQYRPRFGPASTAAPGASSGVGLPAGPGDGSLPGSDPGIRR